MARREDDSNRVVAICVECGSSHAAIVCEGGRIRPIGTDACPCGSRDFEIME
ncbi:hypothetical protein ACFQO4_10955 [Saliphagus sp. GCM10025334]